MLPSGLKEPGADWALHVAQTAQQLGVLDRVAKTTDLNAPASRELVAELLFQGIQKAQVTYTPAFGYVTDKVIGRCSPEPNRRQPCR